MPFAIEIIEGHDSSSYFWFKAVKVSEAKIIYEEDVIEKEEEFSIEEDDVACFLKYFFDKYFDKDLVFNKNRYDACDGSESGFAWNLTHNFYTYDTLKAMLGEISYTARLLESDYKNASLNEIKQNFSIFYVCSMDDDAWKNSDNSAIEKHKDVIIDFYRRFVSRLYKMMRNNSDTDLISIMGP